MLIRTKIIILFFILSGLNLHSQTIKNVQFKQKGKFIEITYQLTNLNFNNEANTKLFVSTNGGLTFIGPLKEVTGDIGKGVDVGNKTIYWEVFKEIPDFSGSVVFDIRAELQTKKIKKQLYVGYTGALETPIGITVGVLGNWGFYVTSRLNSDYFIEVNYLTDGESIIDYDELGYYQFTGNTAYQRFSITAGINKQISQNFHIYVGGGYSEYSLLWQFDKFNYSDEKTGTEYAKHNTESFKSHELETGFRLQLNRFLLSGGIASPGLKRIEVVGSVSFVF